MAGATDQLEGVEHVRAALRERDAVVNLEPCAVPHDTQTRALLKELDAFTELRYARSRSSKWRDTHTPPLHQADRGQLLA